MFLALSFRGTSAHTGDVGIRFPQLFQLENTDCHVASLLAMTGLFVACSILFEADDPPNTSSNKKPGTFLAEGAPTAFLFFSFCPSFAAHILVPNADKEGDTMAGQRWNGSRSVPAGGAAARRDGRRLADVPKQGRREDPPRRGEQRRLWQMGISAALLLLVVTVKLAMPNVMEQYRQQMLKLLGESADFTAAFSSVGRAVSGGTVNASKSM